MVRSSISSPQVDRSKQIQLCMKCNVVVYEAPNEFSACQHGDVINIELTGFDHGTGVECMERDCAFNGVARSTDELAGMLTGHLAHHCNR
ncbi:MAG: hypothetical protein CMI52_02915 [Parcubacteria group bacterium]|nr:hypothetical protein [Parcubacteria group bacterium]